MQNEKHYDVLEEYLNKYLIKFSYIKQDISLSSSSIIKITVFKRKTIDMITAVVLVYLSEDVGDIGQFAQKIKLELAKKIGYVYLLYPLGLQIVFCGNNLSTNMSNLEKYVDKIKKTRAILQSIHVVDFKHKTTVSAITWGQVVSRKFQDSIREGIIEFMQKHLKEN